MAKELTGKCLCGAVRFTFAPAEPHFDACHCGMCRRWGGGPALTVRALAAPAVEGADNVATYKSSEWAERHFCRTCGSHLFSVAPAFDYYGVSYGAIDDVSGLAFTMEIFIDRKPDAYAFANETRKLTEADFVAMVSGSVGKE
ncbi:MAG: GFA family protein [Rhizobiales bacterium]|nr:GFA family protein [Hyphomicrobiales bacterium]